MKLSASTKGLIISVLAVILAFGIYFLFLAKRNYYLVDNPTENTFYFKINNGDEKIISAGQNVKVYFNKCKNSVKVYDQQKKLLYD